MQVSSRQRLSPIPAGVEEEVFDLVVVGAGINGTGIARDAALRGLKVLILDQGDIASGTSSRSGRMIHGGLRYLEHGDIGLVWESLRERATLIRTAPHLVSSQPLLIPLYRGNRHRLWQLRLGLTVLDVFSVLSRSWLGRHEILSRATVVERLPSLQSDGLLGAGLMPDAYARHAERLCVENALSAARAGALVITHARVVELPLENDRLRRLRLEDRITGQSHEVQTRMTVNVAGPWVDRVLRDLPQSRRLIGGTKGSFLVLDSFPAAPSVPCFYEALSDQRQVVALPWNGYCLVGTTDTRFDGDPATAVVTRDEIDYLLKETNRAFPGAQLGPADIRFSYAGVRPLPYVENGAEGSITRKHIVHDHAPEVEGLISIVGGKLSTFRSLAEQTVDLVFKKLGRRAPRCPTARTALPGADTPDFAEFRRGFSGRASLPPGTADRLLALYGTRSREIIEISQGAGDLGAPFDEHTGAIGAEILFACRQEFAETLADVLLGRTLVGYDSAFEPATPHNAVRIARKHGIWDSRRCEEELEEYRAHVKRFQPRALLPGSDPLNNE